jgi:hypothetical protein
MTLRLNPPLVGIPSVMVLVVHLELSLVGITPANRNVLRCSMML